MILIYRNIKIPMEYNKGLFHSSYACHGQNKKRKKWDKKGK